MRHIVYSIGYRKMNIDTFIKTMKYHSINCIIDIRRFASIRMSNYNSMSLEYLCQKNNIEYIPMREISLPHRLMKSYFITKRTNTSFSKQYGNKFLKYIFENKSVIEPKFDIIIEKIKSGKVVCFVSPERNPALTHRGLLASIFKQYYRRTIGYNSIIIEHLRYEKNGHESTDNIE